MDFSSDIKGRGLLVSLNIRQWTASRLDREGGKAAAHAAGADEKRGNYHKRLIDPDMLKPIQQVSRRARDYHERMTVPWTYAGVGMLPGESVMEYDIEMQRYEQEFSDEVEKLIAAYPAAVTAAAKDLGKYFDVREYPTISQVRDKFSLRVNISTLPDAAVDDFRVDIPLSVRDKIRDSVLSEYKGMVSKTKTMLCDKVLHAHERVTAYHESFGTDGKAPFRNTTITNVGEMLSLAERANISDDESIKEAVEVLSKHNWTEHGADLIRGADKYVRAGVIASLAHAARVLQ